MAIAFGIVAAVLLIFGFRNQGELPTLGGWAILLGFVFLSGAVGWGVSDDGCFVDWDGRSNPAVCD